MKSNVTILLRWVRSLPPRERREVIKLVRRFGVIHAMTLMSIVDQLQAEALEEADSSFVTPKVPLQ